MDCLWLTSSHNLCKGIIIINKLEDSRFEQFLRRIVSKIKSQETEIFRDEEIEKLVKIFQITEDSLLLAVKTLVYIVKRLIKYIFMPLDLKNDLKSFGLCSDKADHIVKLWSSEAKTTLDDLDSGSGQKANNIVNFTWSINAELSSDYCKKTKVPKAYLMVTRDKEESDVEIEVTHEELYSMFLQFEAIQNELDNMGI